MNTMNEFKNISLLLASAALLAACARPAGPAVNPNEVLAKRVVGEIPRTDPTSALWETAPEHPARLLLQDQTEPRLAQRTVETLKLRALHDGKWIAFRLEWPDESFDALIGPDLYSDGAAFQVPELAGGDVPDAAMGQKGRPVRISAWKAAWQDRIDKGMDPMRVLYPHGTADHYPHEAAKEEADRQGLARVYSPAVAVGNPVAVHRPDSPTQDLVAEGFGTLEATSRQESVGKGVHDGRRWLLTLARPLDTEQGKALRPGERTYAAFAVWEGSAHNTGSRKMRTGWVPLQIDP